MLFDASRPQRSRCTLIPPERMKSQTTEESTSTFVKIPTYTYRQGLRQSFILETNKQIYINDLLKCFCASTDMCLSSSDGGEELQSRNRLLRLLDAVTDALVWAIGKTGLTFRQQYTRLAHLLMLLSHIRHLR